MEGTTRIERLLSNDRLIIVSGLVLVSLLAWAYLLAGAGMDMPPLVANPFVLSLHPTGTAMAMPWSLVRAVIVVFMWWVMMIAMMLPGAAPVLLLYARVQRNGHDKGEDTVVGILVTVFVAGYLAVWLGFSILATVLQWQLEQVQWLSMSMSTSYRSLSAVLLIVVGIYQFTPLKETCLRHCRSPAEFIASHMKPGRRGAFRMGLEHGKFCLGCCWLLMVLLFVGGVMNILWIAILTLLVLAEKLLSRFKNLPDVIGIILITWGITLLIST